MAQRTFKLDKLVRDGILPYMQQRGQVVVYRMLTNDDEYRSALQAKLAEETAEFETAKTQAERVKEWADIFDVQKALAALDGVELAIPDTTNPDRRHAMGGFAGRIFVETVGVPNGDEWGDYYAAEPDRFPRI